MMSGRPNKPRTHLNYTISGTVSCVAVKSEIHFPINMTGERTVENFNKNKQQQSDTKKKHIRVWVGFLSVGQKTKLDKINFADMNDNFDHWYVSNQQTLWILRSVLFHQNIKSRR